MSKTSVTNILCSFVTLSSKTMSLWHYVSNTPVAHDISFKVETDALVCPKHPNHWERTDEDVCPYFVEIENAYPNCTP